MITTVRPSPFLFSQSITIMPPTESVGDSGVPKWTNASGAVTARASVQPVSSRDALQYGRETGTNVYEVYVEPSSALDALTDAQLKDSIVKFGSRSLRVIGAKRDPISAGAVYVLTCEENY